MVPATVILAVTDRCPVGRLYLFPEAARCLVGRADDCDVRFPGDARGISRHHCVFDIDPPRVAVRDLGSLNGTYVNGRLIGRRAAHLAREEIDLRGFLSCPLQDGDEVQIGQVLMHVGHSASVPIPITVG